MDCKSSKLPETTQAKKIKADYAQIIVCCALQEPYFQIIYFDSEDNNWHIGYGSYCLSYVQQWLKEEFEPGHAGIESAITVLLARIEEAEAKTKKAERERDDALTLLHSYRHICGETPPGRIQELVEADRDGRCTITQCKFGDIVYVVGSKKIVEARIQEIYLDDVSEPIYLVDFTCDNSCDGCPFNSWSQSWEGEWECDGEYGNGAIKQSDFGKTVFLTREAAEAALKARKQDG
jgi:hypothetical protein